MLGWSDDTTSGPMGDYATDALQAYGVSDIADATDTAKLRIIATYYAWRAAADAASTLYDFAADDGEYKRSQMFKAISERLAAAKAEAEPLINPTEPYAPIVTIYELPFIY